MFPSVAVGSISGAVALLLTYLSIAPSKPATSNNIREVRMEGIVGDITKTSTPGMLYPGLGMEPLRRSDYDIIGPTSGKGCAHYVGFWPIPFFFVRREGGRTYWFKQDSQQVATQAGWYEAIEALPGADAMLSPRIHVDEDKFLVWYKRDCAVVKGKGIEIKLDRKVDMAPVDYHGK